MKLPNGYGSVTKLSGNRRKPYVAREGISGRQKPIGYAATKEEALMILADYNKNPWDIENTKVTFEELYSLWLKKRAEKLGKSNKDRLKAAYNYCEKLNNLKYNSIKTYQMQDCIDSCGKSYSMQGAIKNLFYHLDRFAMELDIINKRNSDLLTTAPTPEKRHGQSLVMKKLTVFGIISTFRGLIRCCSSYIPAFVFQRR